MIDALFDGLTSRRRDARVRRDPASVTALTAIGSLASAGATAYAVTQKGQPPKLEPPVRVPTETDPDVLDARKREQERIRGLKGRESTILADADPSAAPSYVNQNLGS